MATRYLFGPVSPEFADQKLHRPRHAADCLAFNAHGTADLTVGPGDTWDEVCRRLPAGWQPDFVVLYPAYSTIPAGLWSAPVPLVGLAMDWNLLWHHYRRLTACDLILTDPSGVDVFARQGLPQARAANLYGCGRDFLERTWPEAPRDIDVLFAGNLHPAVQRERLPWLGRLARLAERRRVHIASGVFGDHYRSLLGRARIVFNRSIRSECNQRAFEATTAGALLFQEAGNGETPVYFRDRQECVSYTPDNLEELLDYYLDHEDERRRIAAAGQQRARQLGFEPLWQKVLDTILPAEWPGIVEHAQRRPVWTGTEGLLARTWQALGSTEDGDPALIPDLCAAILEQPHAAALHNALGLVVSRKGQGRGPVHAWAADTAVPYFAQAVAQLPEHLMAGLNLVEALVGIGRHAQALEQARKVLASLERAREPDPSVWESGHFPAVFDHFRVEWERAAWAHAGQPALEIQAKRGLLRWRLHTLLAELTGDLGHYHEAALARPDLPPTRAALGCALARAGRFPEAVSHLRQAVADNPFDADAARALFQAQEGSGDREGSRLHAGDRRLLARAAPEAVPVESWFAEAAPVPEELTSIIVLCHNEVGYTRLCLESVLQHTRPPFELVVIDNGSTDDTAAYLEEIRTRRGPARVVVRRNATNRGFAAGCNQALVEAHGANLVFLNNDTVVPAGWLEGLTACARRDGLRVGLVGPMSNYASGPQLLGAGYGGLEELEAFAARRRREYAGQALEVGRLTGFCLLVRRAVLDRIGGFDERYGLGFFEDDDLCVRAREAGFRLLLAQDVFIHHFGSRTFAHLGVDAVAQLQKNFAQFEAKWGPDYTAGYRLPVGLTAFGRPDVGRPSQAVRTAWEGRPTSGLPDTLSRRSPAGMPPDHEAEPVPVVSSPPRRCRVSLCLIVKDEEANLPACLESAADLVDEIVVVDTGSTDATKEVAQRFGAKVHDFAWVDSFAAARNESLRHATGDWIFWLDADDRLDEANRRKLRALFAGLNGENVAFAMKCRCVPDPQTGTATVVDHVRLFRNHPQIRWEYRVHEQILPAVRQAGGQVRPTDVVIQHVGYQDAATRKRKQERDLRLLHLDLADRPHDPFTQFNLGWAYEELGRPAAALDFLRRSLERSHPGDSIVRKLYALMAECHRQLGQPAEALAVLLQGRKFYPDDAQLLFQEALRRREQKDLDGAEACLLRLLNSREGPHFASVAEGLRGPKARHQLAVLYREQGRAAEAEIQWRTVLAEEPDFGLAWLGLGQLFLDQARWTELDQLSAHVARAGGVHGSILGAVLRARGHLARQEFEPARELLEETVTRAPQHVLAHVVLSHVLLKQGQDWEAAERVLRRILELDPSNAEAQANLSELCRRQAAQNQG